MATLVHELKEEYEYRFDKQRNHKSYDVILTLPRPPCPDKGITKRPQAMPKKYHDADPVTAYRNVYLGEKARFAKWTKPGEPDWWLG